VPLAVWWAAGWCPPRSTWPHSRHTENQVVGAALLTLLMGVLLALIPVVGFPVLRRHDEVLATGYLVFRVP